MAEAGRLLDRVVRREPLLGDGKSGSLLERGWLDDGTAVVLKHMHQDQDWIMQGTGDDGSRLGRLWDAGVFAALPPVIDHAMLGIDGTVAVMRDVSAGLFPDGTPPTAAQHRMVLEATAQMHRAFADADPIAGLCPVAARLTLLSPQNCAALADEYFVPRLALQAWERFHQVVDAEVSAAVAAIHADPTGLAQALEARPSTLVHGDLKLANLGQLDGRVVLIDWGTLALWGPPATDLAWYIAINAAGLGIGHDQLLDDVKTLGGVDDQVALSLALLGALAQLGWEKALGATSDDETTRRREAAGLRWWQDQARLALGHWAP
jgi:hypothetical protein